jgi:hypothetical protein
MPTQHGGYYTRDGSKVPSVTTVISRFKESGGLIKWGYGRGVEHERLRWQGKPAPTGLYDKGGETADAAQAGTIAHALVESHVKGENVIERAREWSDCDVSVKRRAWNAYEQYCEWQANSKIVLTHTEMPNVSEKHRFAGTLDALGVDAKGNRILVDFKTSNKVYGDHLIQLGAYAILVEENHPDLTPVGSHILRFAKETADFAHHYYGELEEEKRSFLLMRELYELTYKIGKRA